MLYDTIDSNRKGFFDMLMKYCEKNQVCIRDGILNRRTHEFWGAKDMLLKILESSYSKLKQVEMVFESCDKVQTPIPKDIFEKAIKRCTRKEFIPIVKKNFEKWYPKTNN